MSNESAYQCPHCGETIHVANELMGELVRCKHCEEQFQAQAPLAKRQLHTADGDPAELITQSAKEERILRQLHPVVFRNHLFLSTIAFLLAVSGIVAFGYWISDNSLFGLEGMPLLITGIVLAGIAATYYLVRWIQMISVTMKVTSQRTVVIRGIIAQSTNEVQHDDIRNIRSDRNVIERMLNYGDVALSSSGQDDMEIVVHDIPDPNGVIETIRSHQ